MSGGKASLYAGALDGARRAGAWEAVCPVDSHAKLRPSASKQQHAPDGLEWKELVRKFSKHNPQREGSSSPRREESDNALTVKNQ